MTVKIVTDSTSDLPADLAESLGITIVPLNLHFGTEVFKDGVDISADTFYERLTSGPELPKTSQPSIGDFVSVYERLGADAEGILSVHISGKLSGTFNSATQAREQAKVDCPIEVVDTLLVSMALGTVVLKVAEAANSGSGLEELVALAREASQRAQCICLFDTLEYLRKGGRLGKASALIGTLLRVKPMITIRDGEVHELAKERSRKKGIARLQRVAREFAPLEAIWVMYSTTPDEAHTVATSLQDLLPTGAEPLITRFGPVLGTYTGPGALGIGLLRSADR